MRDPIDQSVLAAAVCEWGMTEDGDHEADIALEQVLLTQGVVNSDEVIESFDADHCVPGFVLVTLAGGEQFTVDHAGTVHSV